MKMIPVKMLKGLGIRIKVEVQDRWSSLEVRGPKVQTF